MTTQSPFPDSTLPGTNVADDVVDHAKRAQDAAESCCPPAELATCCAPEGKSSCCAAATTSCGCA
jgi:hypothetical protein